MAAPIVLTTISSVSKLPKYVTIWIISIQKINTTNKLINGKYFLKCLSNTIGIRMPNGTKASRLPSVKIQSLILSSEKCLGIHKGIRAGMNEYRYSWIPADCGRPKPKNMKYTNTAIYTPRSRTRYLFLFFGCINFPITSLVWSSCTFSNAD